MHRRRYLAALTASLGATGLAGCVGVLPTPDETEARYPGGTLVVENTGDDALEVGVSVVEEQYDASLETTVPAGERVVVEEFVTAASGTVVTLAGQVGADGEPVRFEFLPGGGSGSVPPEVAVFEVENAVEASATWTATAGEAS
ncbi:MAG: hypothetical protein ABEJ35_04385 [Halobacteriaceae archaeon]